VSNDDVLGFEDIDDNSNIHDARAVEVESSAVQTNSNEGADKESPRSNGSSQQAASETRTKTVSFSQNGYSEEFRKVDELLRARANSKGYEETLQREESQSPPGFEGEKGRFNQRQEKQTKSKSLSNDDWIVGTRVAAINNSNPLFPVMKKRLTKFR